MLSKNEEPKWDHFLNVNLTSKAEENLLKMWEEWMTNWKEWRKNWNAWNEEWQRWPNGSEKKTEDA